MPSKIGSFFLQGNAGRSMYFSEVFSYPVLNFLDCKQFGRFWGETKSNAEVVLVWTLLKLEWGLRWNAKWTGIVGSGPVISDSN